MLKPNLWFEFRYTSVFVIKTTFLLSLSLVFGGIYQPSTMLASLVSTYVLSMQIYSETYMTQSLHFSILGISN
jgi:hypothetical protein